LQVTVERYGGGCVAVMSFLGRSSSEDAQSSSRRNRLSVATARSSQCPVVLFDPSRHACRCGCFRGLLVTMLRHGATQRRAVPGHLALVVLTRIEPAQRAPCAAWTGDVTDGGSVVEVPAEGTRRIRSPELRCYPRGLRQDRDNMCPQPSPLDGRTGPSLRVGSAHGADSEQYRPQRLPLLQRQPLCQGRDRGFPQRRQGVAPLDCLLHESS
jgi:hypothetical protein